MGLYDRDYGRDYGEETPWDRAQRPQRPQSVTITLIVITCGVFLAEMFVPKGPGGQSVLSEWLAVHTSTLIQPWTWYQFLTYGFLHDNSGIWHIFVNMIGLFFFGRVVEQRLGNAEFLRFYLVSIVLGGIVGSLTFLLAGIPNGSVIGASGGVVATTILFACYYPNAEILLMFVLPVKAWVVAVLFIIMNVAGAMGAGVPGQANTAFTVHLAGAFFALLYYFQRWNLRWLNFGVFSGASQRLRQSTRRAKLKLHDPDRKLQQEADEADRILEKIHAQGESSLTASERRTLERYSRRQREKRREE